MQADDGGDVVLATNPMNQLKDAERDCRVETCNRFIGKDREGALYQRPGDANALLFATGEFVGAAEPTVQQLNPVENIECQASLRAAWRQ
jgi:hypothetical protein